MKAARWWKPGSREGQVVCGLCPRACSLMPGQEGYCRNRRNQEGSMVLATWGKAAGLALDPVEKKPLHHFHPGARVLSFGTVGCNLACDFCQNWHLSRGRPGQLGMDLSPDDIVLMARQAGAAGLAYTYNEPLVWAEWAMDCAEAARQAGLVNVAVTAGSVLDPARGEFFGAMDAANVDLKSMNPGFYRGLCKADLGPVLDTLVQVHHEDACWLEITTLIIPGENDSDAEIRSLADWICRELSPDVPLHLTAFHPAGHMMSHPPTDPALLRRARGLALERGLRYVYTGNIQDPEGSASWCPGCGACLVRRTGATELLASLVITGDRARCRACGTPFPGRFSQESI